MDKRVVFAVAGSGKTQLIIDELDDAKRHLIITYTLSNTENLKDRIIRKFGYFPDNIRLYSYFTFLHSFCYKPFYKDQLNTKGINYTSVLNRYSKKDTRAHYIDDKNRLYAARISKLLLETKIIDEILTRLDKYFDNFYVDEIQDFAANDFNLMIELSKSKCKTIFVGDFYQHTFDTSRDGTTRQSLHDDYTSYQTEFINSTITVDLETLIKSWRCTSTVCEYVSSTLKIPMESNRGDVSEIKFVTDVAEILEIYRDNKIVKLFYREHYKYDCFSKNWGDCKGEDRYFDVCVILNKSTFQQYQKGTMDQLAPSTRNKLYVAITRTKNNLYFIAEDTLKDCLKT